MTKSTPKLEWCIVRLGEDFNWWVEEISDEIRWDIDGLSILDPRQMSHVLELLDPLREYGFDSDTFESAFYKFRIDNALDDNKVRLERVNDSILDSDETLFSLPDLVDEERGPYADLIDHITRLRVKMLNDLINFEQSLTIEELEEEIREGQNNDFMEGRATHVFSELTSILEYVPDGYELELDDDDAPKKDAEDTIEEDFPDLEDENIVEDETMKWDEDDDEEEDEDNEDEGSHEEEDE